MTFGSVLALSPEQKAVFDAGVGYVDVVNDAVCNAVTTAGGGDIYAVGDSLTVGMRDFGEFQTKLEAADWNVLKIEATGGDTVQQGLDKATADKEIVSKAGTIVVALGTNGRTGSPEQLSTQITTMIEGLRAEGMAPNAKIYWLNLYDTENNYQNYNTALVSQAAALNFEIIDFAKEVNTNPAPYAFTDGVHMTGDGYKAKSQFAVDSLGSPGSSTTTEEVDGTASVTGDKNIGYDGTSQIWTEDELAKVEQFKPFYVIAADEADIPWQMIATIHRNESAQGKENPSNGQGIYQFYAGNGGPYPTGPVDDEEFQRQTTFAANFIQDKSQANHSANAGPITKSGTADNVIKDTFYSYNGRGGYDSQAVALGFTEEGQGFEGSPYVMNRADLKRDPTVEPTKSNGTWGQVKLDNGPIEYPANSHWGTWVQYAALAGIDGGGGGDCNPDSVSGSINSDGYAFPVEPQTKKGNGGNFFSDLPCPSTNCHTHTDFVAWDLGREPFATSTGAALYAIYDATITQIDNIYNTPGCYSINFDGKDGFKYFYTHTSNVAVQVGQDVKAGQKIAEIGPQVCVDGGASANQAHLHLEQRKADGSNSPEIVPLINDLYEGLPEE